jgi:hypothetical protein
MGAPVLVLFFFWSASNARHSGPWSICRSDAINPQFSQTNRPLFSSKEIEFPQSVQVSSSPTGSLFNDSGVVLTSFQLEIIYTFDIKFF